ncbi:MAG: hypothetical protein KUG77_28970 [Nannocystaceae bacterium]|nr:hypothetical protein [Nannocystaceae bacterium]
MSDAETRLANILARAAQMQQASDDEDRLTQLEDAAAEVGIDRALMRRAAWEQSLEAVQPPRTLGVPTRVVRRRWLDIDLSDPKTRAHLLARLDSIFGAKGDRVDDAAHATWTARHVVVTFESQGDGTLVQISERFVNTASTMLCLGGTAGLGAGVILGLSLFAAVGKGLLGGFIALPTMLFLLMLGVMLGRSRMLAVIANAEDTFERALTSLELPRENPSRAEPSGVPTNGSSDDE